MLISKYIPLTQILLLPISSHTDAFQVNLPTRHQFNSNNNVVPNSATSLNSLKDLVEDLNASASSGNSRTVFVGGKGMSQGLDYQVCYSLYSTNRYLLN